ncbi:hypothetical protein K227x_23180 [Rubripirellula lacrimiformis]|uniref:MotA/TolQ/ExbB proton channel domain-containing protein n=2 Tax=Rubripirellula lacrimiformis TaxID=1930273 RepID=A0A517N9X8_9BACT|nr:hypothetical protein K227x_23180 [Rubripirellula lacrimiformis]
MSVITGVAVTIVGCFYSIALRNPGGPPVSAGDAQGAIQLAYISCGIGATIALGVPVILMLLAYLERSRANGGE